ncbi:MAG: hypothetical protein AAB354_05510 [candidate division KSB1 bacterium]
MNALLPLRRYVPLLVDWARDGPEERERIRAVMHPLGEFWPWVDKAIAPCYWPSLNRPRGMTMPQFIDECRERVFLWAKANKAEIAQLEFGDDNLRAVIWTIARNTCIEIWRELKRARWESLDDYLESRSHNPQEESAGPRRTPENLQTPPEESALLGKLALEEETRGVTEMMPRFNRSLRPMKKLRELMAALYRLGRREGQREKISAHWFVWRLLRRPKGTQLPQYIRDDLRARWPEVKYAVINARLRCVRRALTNFLLK